MQTLLIAAVLFAGADTEPTTLPKGPPPRVAVVSAKRMMIRTVEYEMVPVTYQVEVEVIEGGKKVRKKELRTAMQPIAREVEHSVKDVKAKTAGGKKLDTETLAKALESPRVVLISFDGKPIDPAYLRLYKPDTPILILPFRAPVVEVLPAPPPPPPPPAR